MRRSRPKDRVLKLHFGFYFFPIPVARLLNVQRRKYGREHQPYRTLDKVGARTTAAPKAEHERARIASPSGLLVNLLKVAFGVKTLGVWKDLRVAQHSPNVGKDKGAFGYETTLIDVILRHSMGKT